MRAEEGLEIQLENPSQALDVLTQVFVKAQKAGAGGDKEIAGKKSTPIGLQVAGRVGRVAGCRQGNERKTPGELESRGDWVGLHQ